MIETLMRVRLDDYAQKDYEWKSGGKATGLSYCPLMTPTLLTPDERLDGTKIVWAQIYIHIWWGLTGQGWRDRDCECGIEWVGHKTRGDHGSS